jgi:hypothetical protein
MARNLQFTKNFNSCRKILRRVESETAVGKQVEVEHSIEILDYRVMHFEKWHTQELFLV